MNASLIRASAATDATLDFMIIIATGSAAPRVLTTTAKVRQLTADRVALLDISGLPVRTRVPYIALMEGVMVPVGHAMVFVIWDIMVTNVQCRVNRRVLILYVTRRRAIAPSVMTTLILGGSPTIAEIPVIYRRIPVQNNLHNV